MAQRLQGGLGFDTGQRRSEAIVNAGSEAEVVIPGAADVRLVWLGEDLRVSSGCAEQHGDGMAGGHGVPGDGHIGRGGALEQLQGGCRSG